MLMELYREHSFKINFVGIILGGIFSLISIIGVFFPNHESVTNSEAISGFYDMVGDYIYWLFIIALGVFIICLWLYVDLYLKLKKFKDLLKTNSKAIFVRNQNELEELAWKLGPKYWDIYVERKKELKIRK